MTLLKYHLLGYLLMFLKANRWRVFDVFYDLVSFNSTALDVISSVKKVKSYLKPVVQNSD